MLFSDQGAFHRHLNDMDLLQTSARNASLVDELGDGIANVMKGKGIFASNSMADKYDALKYAPQTKKKDTRIIGH